MSNTKRGFLHASQPQLSPSMRPVEVVWLDSGLTLASDEAWTPIETMVRKAKLATVHTVGYLAAEDEQAYYIVQSFDPKDMQGVNLMVIAKLNVSEVNHLRRR